MAQHRHIHTYMSAWHLATLQRQWPFSLRQSASMLRSSPTSIARLIRSGSAQPSRCLSSSSSAGGGAKLVVGGLLTASSLVGGTVGYASYDASFRKSVEQSVPGSKLVLEALLGPTDKTPAVKAFLLPTEHAPAAKAVTDTAPSKLKPLPQKRLAEELDDAFARIYRLINKAVLAGEKQIQAAADHMVLVQKALESGKHDEQAWNRVAEAAKLKDEVSRAYEEAVKEVLKTLKWRPEGSSGNEILSSLDNQVNETLLKLKNLQSAIEAMQNKASPINQGQDLAESNRQQFQKWVSDLLGHEVGDNPNEEELRQYLAHAYYRVYNLQQKLVKKKALTGTDETPQPADQPGRSLGQAGHDQADNELRSVLQHLVLAHSDHVADVLTVQGLELERKFTRRLDEAVSKEKSAHSEELSQIVGKVQAMESVMKERAHLEHDIRDAQKLWVSCVSLQRALNDADKEVVDLANELNHIRLHFQDRNPFIRQVLQAVPEQATSGTGIYTENGIRERFLKVERTARRTALIGSEGGSLIKYMLSYLQSLFILTPSTHEMPAKNVPIDISSLSTFDVIWLARGSLDHGDLEQAVRYVGLLQGQAGNVFKDWLHDATALLEMKLACNVLLAHAVAVGAQTFPSSV